MTTAATLLFGTLLGVAAISDVKSRRIPNRLVVFLATAGLLVSALGYTDASTLKESACGIGLGLALWFPFFALGWLGAGDVKLFAASGAWLAPTTTLLAATLGALLGGILSVAWMLHLYGSRGTTERIVLGVQVGPAAFGRTSEVQSDRAVPYGVSLAIAAFTAPWVSDFLIGASHATR